MIRILHIETATKVCSVALSVDGELAQIREFSDDGFAHGEQLTILIQEVLDLQGITAGDLSAVSVSAGPGSYTGLRIGVSTAKGLCYALTIPLISTDTLQAMAEVARIVYPDSNLCPMIDARRMEVFSLITNFEAEILKPVSADVLDENSYTDLEPFVCFGDGAQKVQEMWKDRRIIFDLDLKPSARGQIASSYRKFLNGEFEDVAYFEPAYLKEFYQTPAKKS
ncbi:tRNA (adenosine(37)-N6)-threonylcarbamoyltransferase complex dimerization subunit type 1 TsaB [Fluviicola chungangensis]|uniref:tRNA (Adenosine(37)-N6)-threonylcarbamoyltransferase complex dimerization subunit type 1 TsaB n=1 Tax=Fluviicola chungangensis TaxID=2597671 RepID=A0A556N1B5_9FLAO|nr:tRNA (adenosine(37)-N6)-threonylcarbamoyltransferase complex dimerization subunit type 1 TsaB [Fluviicola chungangensis]TSJ45819.1 tRNA (adenosine(37)-N6)-threonylcarbamoyltransferase complex dimerization subunit type 1 TsaB [Fluviicola chungangensis]